MKYCDPRYDITFKKVFAQNPDLMISLLNALLPLKGDQIINKIEYLTPEMIPEMPNASGWTSLKTFMRYAIQSLFVEITD